jgi:hypothetical protein
MSTESHPPIVERLHYEFEGWEGDEILESFPCFIVTERLADAIRRHGLTGAAFDHVEISRSDTFDELQPMSTLPTFVWMKINGDRGKDDFWLAGDGRLVVSERAWELIRPLAPNAVVSEFPQP